MENFYTHVKPMLPVLGAIGGFILALIIGFRYKIPDLTRRMESLEKKGAKNKDLNSAIDSFHTVCRFNQVSCQKEVEINTRDLMGELDGELDVKLAEMYDKLNKLAISNADLAAKVQILIRERENGNNNH